MKFSIITSCFNAEKYISETVESVCQQTEIINKNCELEYIIIDGNSTDKTNIIINDLKKKYPFITHIIEEDNGLYDGLSKGFKLASGDVMGYLNAGDFFNKTAFSVLRKVFDDKKINWVTGLKIIYNNYSEITKIQIPYNYRSNLIRCGAYGKYLPFIQQESTFWRTALIKNLDMEYFRKLEKSGDMFLWYNFAKKNNLYIINSYLSGFKYHENQLTFRETGSTDLYLEEAKYFINKLNVKDLFFILLDSIPWYIGRNTSNIFNFINSKFIDYLSDENWRTKIKRKKLYCWVSDFEKTNGEGITANLFIKNLFNNNNYKKEDIFIKNISNKINYLKLEKMNNTVRGGKLNFLEKYLDPFLGIFYLWCKFLTGNKVAFINFLPLWNFVIFLFLPPGTILGPITGTTAFGKNVNGFEKFFRKYLMPIQFQISNLILLLRYKNLTFNTSNLKSILSKKVIEKSKFNFIYTLYDLESKKLNVNKEFDFIFYIRTYPSKGTTEIVNFINLLKKDFKIMTVGEKLNIQEIHEHGLLSRDHVLELCKKTKFTIISSENFYSLFSFDCISSGVKVFFDEKMSYEKTFEEDQKVFPLDFNNVEEACQKITKKIKDLS